MTSRSRSPLLRYPSNRGSFPMAEAISWRHLDGASSSSAQNANTGKEIWSSSKPPIPSKVEDPHAGALPAFIA